MISIDLPLYALDIQRPRYGAKELYAAEDNSCLRIMANLSSLVR